MNAGETEVRELGSDGGKSGTTSAGRVFELHVGRKKTWAVSISNPLLIIIN